MALLEYLLGKPLSTEEEGDEKVGVPEGVAVFGLDALGSAAYGPEAALTILIPAGVLGLRYILPLSGVICALLFVVYLSYLQTIGSYPGGGGAYTVAGQNLGPRFGMLAGAALMLDYLLNVSVGISTGIGALVSAVPSLQPHSLALCLGVLLVLIVVNLRGVRESGSIWMVPTYLFVICLLVVVLDGCVKGAASGWHPKPMMQVPHSNTVTAGVGAWLLIKAFAAGCTALTGVEAVSNGMRSFKDPREGHAKGTLTFIVVTLAVLLIGVSVLVHAYGITATEPGRPGYQSLLSMLTESVMGRGWFYYVTIGSILTVLSLSANTSFAGFPQLCRVMAEDGYLPKAFTMRGRRLAYTVGIVVLGVLSAGVLVLFGGVTDRLIPLFAIGAFLAFTMSQAGMVWHWRKSGKPHAWVNMTVNAVGAIATGLTVLVIFVAKFTSGAWLTVAALGLTVLMLSAMRRHHDRVERLTHVSKPTLDPLPRLPMMLVPVSRWNSASQAAVQFACSLSDDVRVLHISDVQNEVDDTCRKWQHDLNEAAQQSGVPAPRVVGICSPYRSLAQPVLDYVAKVEKENPGRKIAVIVAEIVALHWYHHVMHNYRAMALKIKLYLRGNKRVVIVDMPWQVPEAG